MYRAAERCRCKRSERPARARRLGLFSVPYPGAVARVYGLVMGQKRSGMVSRESLLAQRLQEQAEQIAQERRRSAEHFHRITSERDALIVKTHEWAALVRLLERRIRRLNALLIALVSTFGAVAAALLFFARLSA